MRFFNRVIVFFYTFIFTFVGTCLIIISFHLAGKINLSFIFDYVLTFKNLYLLVGFSGALLILVSLSLAGISYKKFQAEKTIGYATGGGQVIISLGAIEDFIRKISQQSSDVKELRSEVIVTRRGIEIETRAVLFSTSNIPDVTERLQTIIRNQVQELLAGIDKPIMVNVHVVKIAHKDHDKAKKDHQPEMRF